MLVVPDSRYNKRVSVTIGTLHIDWMLELATEEELDKLNKSWKRVDLSTKMVMKQTYLRSLKETGYDI